MNIYVKTINGEVLKVISYDSKNLGYDVELPFGDRRFVSHDEVIQLSYLLPELRDEFIMTYRDGDTPEIVTPKDEKGKPFKSKIQRLRIVLAQYNIEFGFRIQCATYVKNSKGEKKLEAFTQPYKNEGGFKYLI